MDSPPQYSPSSTPSDVSPAGEEASFQAPSGGGFDKGFLNNISSHLSSLAGGSGGGPSKRRLGGSSAYAHGTNRDPKSRRRENSGRMDSMGWEGKGPGGPGKREKDDLLDPSLVDYLRKGA